MAIHPIEYRYNTEEMRKVWEADNKLQKMLEVEAALADAEAQLNIIPKEAADEIKSKASTKYVKSERVSEIEMQTHHDIASIVKALAEVCEGDAGEYVHFGATSNDIIDTSQSLLFKETISIIREKVVELTKTLLKLADDNKKTVCIGRTHGQHALPTTYGMKFAIWADELHRQIERLDECNKRICVGMLTGAVGTTAALGTDGLAVHNKVSEILGLRPVLISSQIVQRDVHAEFIMCLANIASTLEKMALEIRNLQRTEIDEIGESFDPKKQVGSSTMPHKRNPITGERICGISRVIRAYVAPALQNNPLWHERDLTNSSCERIILPESSMLTDYILKLSIKLFSNLVFHPENIEHNLNMTNGLIMAERFMAELTRKGAGKQTAYALVRNCSLEAYDKDVGLKEIVSSNSEIKKYLTEDDIEKIMDPHTYLGSSIQIVENVLKDSNEWF
ncbi:adenylosuccinate lyase [Methanobacterium paludis]|uniref:Adenylosuccinate lyase n=1 Tax=Methanobacterium paludis (strain DSM 25820 / JCM 18151 / SWAN1) TaxID=868131 RepID=F6D7R6_METPW|nr:adenylosuccinate lyase [Methanobacterium paludis]AEG17145.1 adenylosuccinate lyase [Methanobacterium paludis]